MRLEIPGYDPKAGIVMGKYDRSHLKVFDAIYSNVDYSIRDCVRQELGYDTVHHICLLPIQEVNVIVDNWTFFF